MKRGTASLWSLLVAIAVVTSTTAQTTFTWTGNAATVVGNSANTSFLAAGNWAGHAPPVSDGTATGTNLVFGSSAGVNEFGWVGLEINQNFAVRSLTFNPPYPSYYFDYQFYGDFGLGAGGITVGGGANNYVEFNYSTNLNLLASQTWHVAGNLSVYGEIHQVGGTHSVTKTGPGQLLLDDTESTFSGGFDLQAGTLVITGSSEVDGGILNGPVGRGTLTLRDHTALFTQNYSDITLDNPLVLGTGVTIGVQFEDHSYRFTGTVTPLNQATILYLGTPEPVYFSGGIANATAGATTLTFATSLANSEPGIAILAGPNTYSGGTVADGAGVIFFSAQSLPAAGAITALNAGYVATGYNGGMTAILSRIASPASFNGVLGFDTDPQLAATPTTFADPLNLTAFSNDHTVFRGLGTQTSAILTGAITPPTGGEYVFGGGSGVLQVMSNLGAAGAAGVRVQSLVGQPLTVVFQGANTYTGTLKSDHSVVILDSPTALPAGAVYQLDDYAYVGYTESFTGVANPAAFLARLNGASYSETSVLGFDTTAANLPGGRSIADPVNLSALADDIYLGSATKVYLDGPLTAPATGTLSLTGVKGGKLMVTGQLAAANVARLRIGLPDDDSEVPSLVLLASGASNFTGNTTFHSGILALAASSVEDGGVLQGPIGRGTLAVVGFNPHYLAAATNGLTLDNPVSFDHGASFTVGVPETADPGHPAYPYQDWADHNLTLAGAFSGLPSTIRFTGTAQFTLNADNAALTTSEFAIGGEGSPLLVAAHDHALGSTSSLIRLEDQADLQFTTLAPSIGAIMGGFNNDGIYSYVVLPNGAELTINQFTDGHLTVSLGGTPTGGFSTASGSATSSASLVKNGAGRLTLTGESYLTGGLTVNAGSVFFGSMESTGVGPITLNGGTVGTSMGVLLANPISFGASGGTLTGNAVFGTAITAGNNVVLAPGGSPGMLTFAAGLTFAPGGSFEFEVAEAAGSPGWSWDLLAISGALAGAGGKSLDITATLGTPFTLNLVGLGLNNTVNGTPVGFDAFAPYAWTIAIADNGINGFSADKFVIDPTLFSAANGGSFSLSVLSLGGSAEALRLNFTPVPEPSAAALLAVGLGALVATLRRRRA